MPKWLAKIEQGAREEADKVILTAVKKEKKRIKSKKKGAVKATRRSSRRETVRARHVSDMVRKNKTMRQWRKARDAVYNNLFNAEVDRIASNLEALKLGSGKIGDISAALHTGKTAARRRASQVKTKDMDDLLNAMSGIDIGQGVALRHKKSKKHRKHRKKTKKSRR